MLVIFGKGKVGNAVAGLCDYLGKKYFLVDDKDRTENEMKVLELLTNADKIITSPWIPQDHFVYENFSDKIIGELAFVDEIMKEEQLSDMIECVGITGTNGKSSTTWILYTLFEKLFKKEGIEKKVYISGNFGTPLSAVLVEILEEKLPVLIILEVSSFMLYRSGNFKFDYGILTNIARDHLDWHKDFDEYSSCKIRLLEQTKKQAFTTKENYSQLADTLQRKIEIYGKDFDLGKTQFLWEHNQYNFMASDMLVKKYYQDHDLPFIEEHYKEVLSQIEPLEHRMKLLKRISFHNQEIKIYDDGICTSAHALNGALSCFSGEENKIVLIAWGYDKGDDYTSLAPAFQEKLAFVSLMGITWKTKLLSLCEESKIPHSYSDTLQEALDSALAYAKENTIWIILFSPWSASFDMFKNVYDRCDQFVKLVEEL